MKENFEQSIFQTLFTESSLGLVIVDSQGLIVMTNPEILTLFGYDKNELEGERISILIPQEYRAGHKKHEETYQKNPTRRRMGEGRELYGQRKDGTKFPLEISLNSFQVDEEQYTVAFVHDISIRLSTAKALQESESRLSAIINTAIDGIVTISQRGEILSINPAGAKLFGYQSEEVVGQNISILMPPPDQENHDSYLSNYKKTGRKNIIATGREVFGLKKDKSTFPLFLSVSEVILKDRTFYTGILHDLTEQKLAEAQLKETALNMKATNEKLEAALQQLQKSEEILEEKVRIRTAELRSSEQMLKESLSKEIELNEMKSRFVSMASHEFRTPLSSILSSASLIQMYLEKGIPEKQFKHIQRIQSSVNNLTAILNDFLSLEKLESGNIEATLITINFQLFLQEVREEMTPLIGKDRTVDFQHSGKEEAVIDVHLMKNIFFNLLSNAIKYSPKDKPIEVHSSCETDALHVRVKDYGIGIPENDQKHLFSRFFRATNSSNIQGTGLGLNIVKRYLDLMSGTIAFESQEGVGTTFMITIPQPLSKQ